MEVKERCLLITLAEVCERLALGRSKVYELMAAGELRPLRIGRSIRFPIQEVESFVRRLQEEQGVGVGR